MANEGDGNPDKAGSPLPVLRQPGLQPPSQHPDITLPTIRTDSSTLEASSSAETDRNLENGGGGPSGGNSGGWNGQRQPSTFSCIGFVTDAAFDGFPSAASGAGSSNSSRSHHHVPTLHQRAHLDTNTSHVPRSLLQPNPLEEEDGLYAPQITVQDASPGPSERRLNVNDTDDTDKTVDGKASTGAESSSQQQSEVAARSLLGLLNAQTSLYSSPPSNSPISGASALNDENGPGSPSQLSASAGTGAKIFNQNRRRRMSVSSTPDIEKALNLYVDLKNLPASGIPGLDEAPAMPHNIPPIDNRMMSDPRTPPSVPAPLHSDKDNPSSRTLPSQPPQPAVEKAQERPEQPHIGHHYFPNQPLLDLYLIMEDPSTSTFALFVNCWVVLTILIGSGVAVAGTVDVVMNNDAARIALEDIVQPIIIALYTFEWFARLIAHTGNKKLFKRFWKNILTYSDFLAFSVYFIELPLQTFLISTIFRFVVLRLLRLTRLFRTYRYRSGFQMSIDAGILAVEKSTSALWAMFHLAATIVALFATAIYFAERGTFDTNQGIFIDNDGEPSKFKNLGFALWFTFVTLTTTGYGDLVPKTWLGRVLAVPVMWIGVVLLALPSIVVGRQFIQIMDYWRAQRQHHKELVKRPTKRARKYKKNTDTAQTSVGSSKNKNAKATEHDGAYLNMQVPWRKPKDADSTAVDLGNVGTARKPINIPERAMAPPTPRQRSMVGMDFQSMTTGSLPHLEQVAMAADSKRFASDTAALSGPMSMREEPPLPNNANLNPGGLDMDDLRFASSRICQHTYEVIATRSTRDLVDLIRDLRKSMSKHQGALNQAYHALEDLVEGLCDEYGSGEEVMSIN